MSFDVEKPRRLFLPSLYGHYSLVDYAIQVVPLPPVQLQLPEVTLSGLALERAFRCAGMTRTW